MNVKYVLLILVMVNFILIPLTWFVLNKIFNSNNWVETSGVILKSEVETLRNGSSSSTSENKQRSYKLNIEYKYSVAGRDYIGNRIVPLLPQIYKQKSIAEEAAAGYSVNSSVKVFYDEKDFSNSCLVPKIGNQIFLLVVAFIASFAITIIGGLLWYSSNKPGDV